jgi:hypothetical protein
MVKKGKEIYDKKGGQARNSKSGPLSARPAASGFPNAKGLLCMAHASRLKKLLMC